MMCPTIALQLKKTLSLISILLYRFTSIFGKLLGKPVFLVRSSSSNHDSHFSNNAIINSLHH